MRRPRCSTRRSRRASRTGGSSPWRRAPSISAASASAGELPGGLRAFPPGTAPLGDAIAEALAGRGARPQGLSAGRFHLPSGSRTLVMGVINATPDSFSGDGTGGDVGTAVAQAMAMVEEGADIVDVGG